jgi:hypothetical protein
MIALLPFYEENDVHGRNYVHHCAGVSLHVLHTAIDGDHSMKVAWGQMTIREKMLGVLRQKKTVFLNASGAWNESGLP